jgi:hypothetical protein
LNGTSTEYAAGNATSYFGSLGVPQYVSNQTIVPGVNPNLLPTNANLYGASYVGTATEITFTAQNLTM